MASPVARESRLAINAFLVQFVCRHGKTKRTRSFPEPQGASRAGTNTKSKTQTPATPACERKWRDRRQPFDSLERNGHGRVFASSSHEDRKDVVDQVRVRGDAASGAANSRGNDRGGCKRVCKASRLARDTPVGGTADRILQRRKPPPGVARRNDALRRLETQRDVPTSFHWTAQSCWLTNAPTIIKWKQRKFISLSSAF